MNPRTTIRLESLAVVVAFAIVAMMMQSIGWTAAGGDCESDGYSDSDAKSRQVVALNESFDKPVETKLGCCSSKQLTPKVETNSKKCCCSSKKTGCSCVDCSCSKPEHSQRLPPAIPAQETTEIVAPIFIAVASFEMRPRQGDARHLDVKKEVVEHSVLSSQQVCVLLSRFTC